MCSNAAPQIQFRSNAREMALTAFSSAADPGSALTYQTFLRSIAPEVVGKLCSGVLPMDYGFAFYGSFASVLRAGPRSPSPTTSQPSAPWSSVKPVRAEAAHSRRDMDSAFGGIAARRPKEVHTHVP